MPHDVATYAKERGFLPEEVEQFQWRIEGNDLLFPILTRNGSWGDKRRHLDGREPKWLNPKGVPRHLYNPLGLGPNAAEVWFAESEIDAMSLIVVGAPAVGLSGTNGFDETWRLLFKGADIVLALDSDVFGREAMERISRSFPEQRVAIFDHSPYKDANEWLVADRKGFTRAVLEFEFA